MSGWIKLEKDRRDDPRVIRMARELRNAGVTHERFTSAMHVTLVLGCLDVLWCYADTHVREDDSLDLGPDEIDELVGLKGFCSLIPSDWLEVLDANRVKLPDFHAHNGTESKKKALNQKRQERKRNADALQEVTPTSRTSVTPALPDLDQTKTYTKEETNIAHVRLSPVDQAEAHVMFERIRKAYPPFAGRQNWIHVEVHCHNRIAEGSSWNELIDAVKRYAAYVKGGGVSSTAFVLSPEKFFSAGDDPWKQAWPLPEKIAKPVAEKPRFVPPAETAAHA
jgi:hypothetical protein